MIGKDDSRYKCGDSLERFGSGVYKFGCSKDNLEKFDGIGIFRIYRSMCKLSYDLCKEYESLCLEMGSGCVNEEV